MQVNATKENEILIVKVIGRLDSNTYEDLQKEMMNYVNEKKIIMDFDELDYISSAGLRVVLMNAKKMKKTGGQFRLCGMKDFIKEIFDIAGFSRILNIDSNLEEAKGHF